MILWKWITREICAIILDAQSSRKINKSWTTRLITSQPSTERPGHPSSTLSNSLGIKYEAHELLTSFSFWVLFIFPCLDGWMGFEFHTSTQHSFLFNKNQFRDVTSLKNASAADNLIAIYVFISLNHVLLLINISLICVHKHQLTS